jgi:predicted dehydrogenase
MNRKIKTAVIGVGHLGQHHARWYKNIPQAELVGVYDIDQEKCRRIAGELDIRPFEKLADLIGQIDAVSIVVPTIDHYKTASELLANGINCLVEKPITASSKEAEELINLAASKDVILTVGHIERFNPAIQALGKYNIEPRFIEAHRLAAFDPRGTDVAVILDLMIHDIELALYLTNSEVDHIEASAVPVISDRADIANARLTFKNGAVANLTASRISLRAMRKLRIFQKSGYFSLDLAEKRADIYRLSENNTSEETGMKIPLGKSDRQILYNTAGKKDEDMLCAELVSFINSVANNSEPEVSPRTAACALDIALEIERIGLEGMTG